MTSDLHLTKAQATFLADPRLQRLFDTIENADGQLRVNGGAVRNALLDQPVDDVDLSTTMLPDHVVEHLQQAAIKVVPTGIEHGTVTAIIDGAAYEITTLRKDIKTDGRHAVVEFGSDWKEDALRRDFTINALYCDRSGEIYDPLGGIGDLRARRIRFIGDADTRIREDRLRILRFFRMFAYYGSGRPDSEGLKACVRHRDSLLDLSAERVWSELRRLLAAPDPLRALLWMRTTQILSQVLPESEKWGIDSVGPVIRIADATPDKGDPLLPLMAMLPPQEEKIAGMCERLKLSNAQTNRLSNWLAAKPQFESAWKDRPFHADRCLIYRLGRRAFLDNAILYLARMHDEAQNDERQRSQSELLAAYEMEIPQFPVKGRHLVELGLEPGPLIGETLAELERQWLSSGFRLTSSQLLKPLADKR